MKVARVEDDELDGGHVSIHRAKGEKATEKQGERLEEVGHRTKMGSSRFAVKLPAGILLAQGASHHCP
jgi:hypothetical protein